MKGEELFLLESLFSFLEEGFFSSRHSTSSSRLKRREAPRVVAEHSTSRAAQRDPQRSSALGLIRV